MDTNKLDEILKEYEGIEGSLISILQKTQDVFGCVSPDAIYYISAKTGISPAKIMGVVTFYAQFRLKPAGKYLIMLCKGTACHVNGAGTIEKTVCEELGIKDGETTEDGLFTLKTVACLGCCSLSPVMMINGEAYGSLTPASTIEILNEYKNRG